MFSRAVSQLLKIRPHPSLRKVHPSSMGLFVEDYVLSNLSLCSTYTVFKLAKPQTGDPVVREPCLVVQLSLTPRPTSACGLQSCQKIGSGHLHWGNWSLIIKHIGMLSYQSCCRGKKITFIPYQSQFANLWELRLMLSY